MVLVPPCLPEVQHQPHRHCYFLDCPRKFRLRPLLCFHNLFTRVITLSKGGGKTRSRQLWVSWGPTHYIYRTYMISYPTPSNVESLRYASTSGQIQHMWNWCPKLFHLQCGLDIVVGGTRPSNEQHTHISVIMRITCSSAKLGSHQQSRYHRNVRFAMGTTPSLQLYRWLLFQKLSMLSILDGWNLLYLFFMVTFQLWCWRDRSWRSLYQHVSHGLIVLCRHIVVLAKYIVANERWQSLIGGCNNDRWPNDTC